MDTGFENQLFLESCCSLLSLLENKLEGKAARYEASLEMTLLSGDMLTSGNNRPSHLLV